MTEEEKRRARIQEELTLAVQAAQREGRERARQFRSVAGQHSRNARLIDQYRRRDLYAHEGAVARLLGSQASTYTGSGVSSRSGSALAVRFDTLQQAALDRFDINQQADIGRRNERRSASLARRGARLARRDSDDLVDLLRRRAQETLDGLNG